jgi:hypothetical protein
MARKFPRCGCRGFNLDQVVIVPQGIRLIETKTWTKRDFLIDFTNQEVASLRSQFVTLKTGRGEHRKYRQLAFTEHGAIMAATILNSPRAVHERLRRPCSCELA